MMVTPAFNWQTIPEGVPYNTIAPHLPRYCRDFNAITPGMTRQDVEKKLPMDGGLQSAPVIRFQHPQCAYLKVRVGFAVRRNQADQGRVIWDDNDKVVWVSPPYLELPFCD